MEEPKLNEEELIGLSEEEKQKKLAELQRKKDEYWEERMRRNVYDFGAYVPDYSKMTLDVEQWDQMIKEKIANMRKENGRGNS